MDSGVRIGAFFCAAAAAGAVVLFSPNPPTASAATGSFTYTDAAGKSQTSSNPPSGRCVALVGSGLIKNMTNAEVSLYDSMEACQRGELKDRIAEVGKMKSSKEPVPAFQAVHWDD